MARERLEEVPRPGDRRPVAHLIQGAARAGPDVQFHPGAGSGAAERIHHPIKKRLSRDARRHRPGLQLLRARQSRSCVRINRDKAADLNVSVASIATALRTLVGGDEQVTTYREGDDRYDVQLRVERSFAIRPALWSASTCPRPTLGNVPVANVAALEPGGGPVPRSPRYNRQRQIMITANLVEGQSLSNVLDGAEQTVAELNLPPEYRSGLLGRSRSSAAPRWPTSSPSCFPSCSCTWCWRRSLRASSTR
jgi:multidrug efflux pump subunit AcrB